MADTKTIAPKEGAGTRFWNWLTETQVWTSIFRHDRPDTDRGRVLGACTTGRGRFDAGVVGRTFETEERIAMDECNRA